MEDANTKTVPLGSRRRNACCTTRSRTS